MLGDGELLVATVKAIRNAVNKIDEAHCRLLPFSVAVNPQRELRHCYSINQHVEGRNRIESALAGSWPTVGAGEIITG